MPAQICGITIILTRHYSVEAEEMADRIGMINKGRQTLLTRWLL